MKKKKLPLLCLFIIIIITGCTVTNEERIELTNVLEKNKIIEKDSVLIDEMTCVENVGISVTHGPYYIYKTKNNNMFILELKPSGRDKQKNRKYKVTVYKNITYASSRETTNNQEGNCRFGDGTKGYSKYNFSEKIDNYIITKQKILFWYKYKVKKINN